MTASPLLNRMFGLCDALISVMLLASPAMAVANDHAALQAWLADTAAAPVDGLAPGSYDRARLAELAPYLPPGYQDQFDFAGLEFELEPTQHYAPHVSYEDASLRFAGQARIADDGSLAGHQAGQPFTAAQIESADAVTAGYMVAWDHVHRWEHLGFNAPDTLISYIRAGGAAPLAETDGLLGAGVIERQMHMSYRRTYLSGLAPLAAQDYRLPVRGGDGLLFKERIEVLAPFDVAGTTIILERPLDQALGDQVNSYLPTERRVRRLSARERADSWMGTNWTLDDFGGYAGLVMDNTWRYLGRKVVPYVANTRNEHVLTQGPLSAIPLDRWQLRPCYVVEAVPRWKGHPYGRRVLFIDAETFSVALTLVYDRDERLYKVINGTYAHGDGALDGDPSLTTSRMRSSLVLNLREQTANVARVLEPTDYAPPKTAFLERVFSVADLNSGR
jgi:hypothetical protein